MAMGDESTYSGGSGIMSGFYKGWRPKVERQQKLEDERRTAYVGMLYGQLETPGLSEEEIEKIFSEIESQYPTSLKKMVKEQNDKWRQIIQMSKQKQAEAQKAAANAPPPPSEPSPQPNVLMPGPARPAPAGGGEAPGVPKSAGAAPTTEAAITESPLMPVPRRPITPEPALTPEPELAPVSPTPATMVPPPSVAGIIAKGNDPRRIAELADQVLLESYQRFKAEGMDDVQAINLAARQTLAKYPTATGTDTYSSVEIIDPDSPNGHRTALLGNKSGKIVEPGTLQTIEDAQRYYQPRAETTTSYQDVEITDRKAPGGHRSVLFDAKKGVFVEPGTFKEIDDAQRYYRPNTFEMSPDVSADEVDYWTKQVAIDSKNFGLIKNKKLQNAVSQNLAGQGYDITNIGTTTRDAAKFAKTAMKHIGDVDSIINTLEKQGKMGPIMSRWGDFMAGTVGMGDPEFAKLRTNILLLDTVMGRVHGGARGGGSQIMLEHFKSMLNARIMDPRTLRSSLRVIEDWLGGYADMVPTLGKFEESMEPPPSAKEGERPSLDSFER